MVGLIRFENKIFKTSNTSTKTFDEIYDSAMVDVKDNKKKVDSKFTSLWIITIIAGLVIAYSLFKFLVELLKTIIKLFKLNPILFLVAVFVDIYFMHEYWLYGVVSILLSFFILRIVHNIKLNKKSSKINAKLPELKVPNQITKSIGAVNYFREIPFDGNIWCAALAAEFFYDFNYKDSYIIGALLLKWLQNDNITVSGSKNGLFNVKDNNYVINFNNTQGLCNIELNLWNILKSASGNNNILEANEFRNWCKKHYEKMFNWFKDCRLYEQSEAKKLGYVEPNGYATTTLKTEGEKLLGLKKFLLDFSLMPERETFDVKLWENYLIYAEILGIADKVEEQFSKIYPKFNDVSKLNKDYSALAITCLAVDAYTFVNEGHTKELNNIRDLKIATSNSYDYSGSSRDSGGGGSSYSSGGGSAGGSSGGGFR